MSKELTANTKVAHYSITKRLGVGGMGEVYLALDTELHRPVALKFLPEDVASDQKRMNRFIQEARAASALNHPNILTVYQIGQAGGMRFFATEYVDGVTLRKHIQGRMKLDEVLDITIQVTRALVAAHAAGIVHRDIKPENIMLRRDGFVKVLDFGLAKLTENQATAVDTEAATQALVNTDPGAVMGTVGYMSPEQASGKGVDARTDLWSLGVVLYEMVTAHLPFEGRSPSHIIVAITDKDPLPLSHYVDDIPEALEWIVTETLTKDPEERTQTAKELLKKLQRLKQRLDAAADLERSVAPTSGTASPSGSGFTATDSLVRRSTQSSSVSSPATLIKSQTTASSGPANSGTAVSSAEYIVSGIRNHKTAAVFALGLIVVAMAGFIFIWNKLSSSKHPITTESRMKITRLISGLSGQPGGVTISPDGKYVAYSVTEAGKTSLWVRQVSQDTSLQIVAPIVNTRLGGTTFSNDGELIYFIFVTGTDFANPGVLYQIPVLGGREPKKIIEHLRSPISFSPDGKSFAFVRAYPNLEESHVMIANADGSGERKLAVRKNDDWFNYVAWSPDGKTIACAANSVKDGFFSTVVEVPVEGGSEKPLTSQHWNGEMHRLLWLHDGSGLIFSVGERPSYHAQIWRLSYPGGEARRVTNDLNHYGTWSLGVTADSSTIATLLENRTSNIWVASPNEDESRARKITNGKYDGQNGLATFSDGRIVYGTMAGDNRDLWIMNADGTGGKPITSDSYLDENPTISPDGRYIIYISSRPDHLVHVWRMNVDGGDSKQLTNAEDWEVTCSPDGRWLVFSSFRTGHTTLWKVPIDGGDATQVSDKVLSSPVFSPDGKQLMCNYYDDSVTTPSWRPAIISFEDGNLVKVLDLPTTARRPIWSADGREYLYVNTVGGVGNIWSQPVAGGPARQLTKFSSDSISNFAVAPGGKHFIITRQTVNNEIILIKDFK